VFISAFDLDFTLLNDNSSYRFGRYLCAQKHIPRSFLFFITWCHISFLFGWMSLPQLHENAFKKLFYKKKASLIEKWVEEFLALQFNDLLYQPAIQKLKAAQLAGHLTVILSSSPAFLVKPIAKLLNVPVWKSTEYQIDDDGDYSHINSLMLGETKASFIQGLQSQNGLTSEDVIAYSDSHFDLPFLFAAGAAVGVNPDRKLRAICRQNQWPII